MSASWSKRALAVAAVATIGMGIVEGYVARRMFDARQAEALQEWRNRLGQAADQQALVIGAWAGDFLGDVEVLASLPMLPRLLTAAPPRHGRLAQGGDQAPREHFRVMLEAFDRHHKYRAACLVDLSGRILASRGDGITPELIQRVLPTFRSADGSVLDVFLAASGPAVVAAAPVRASQGGQVQGERAPSGVVLLTADPEAWLYPQLLRQPVPSSTAESLLTGMDGNRPVLIGPMRHVAVPVPAHAFPAAAPAPAVAGDPQRAAVDPDLDYRGVSVIAASRPIPNTPWTVIAKIDRAEAFGDLAGAAWSSLAWWGAVMVALIAVVYGLLRHRETIHVRQQLESTEQIGFLNRLLRTISEVNELMVREKNRKRLLEETCRSIVEHAGFTMAWVGEIEPPFRVKPVAWAGAVEGYLDGIDVRYDDSPEGFGPTGTSIRERGVSAVEDVASAPAMVPWREKALARGYRSVAAVPLIQADRVLGALTVYSSEPGILRGEVLSLIQKLASDLAFALDVIERGERHLETERALSASEEQLRQAQKMEAIGRLAGGVAHDFNNLLMAISGYAELALSARTEETRRERIEEIATAAERAAALTRQLLAFSRKQVLQPRVFNLNAIVADIEKMLRRLIGENIELVTRLAPALHNVRADQGQMEQVLVNLAVNARDAMLHGGRMVIETANVDLHQGDAAPAGTPGPGPYVMLTVEDTGEGMAPDTLDRLFEPFFTTKASGKGTGLGLSTVYGIVAQSGGTITVESAVGAGSTFRVYLPAATMDEEAMEKAAQPSVPRAGGESLLVVEDNPAVRNFVIEALRGAGYEVTDADSAERALQLLAARNAAFDLLLTDVILPKMDGHDLARQAKAQRPTLRVLYMSGYVDNPRLREAALHEGIDLIEKPFTSAAIAARVRAVLDRTEASGQ